MEIRARLLTQSWVEPTLAFWSAGRSTAWPPLSASSLMFSILISRAPSRRTRRLQCSAGRKPSLPRRCNFRTQLSRSGERLGVLDLKNPGSNNTARAEDKSSEEYDEPRIIRKESHELLAHPYIRSNHCSCSRRCKKQKLPCIFRTAVQAAARHTPVCTGFFDNRARGRRKSRRTRVEKSEGSS